MEPRLPALHHDALELLKTIGHAASAGGDRFRFEYRPLPGYPFGWLFHPGLRDGLSVVASADLTALEHTDIVRLEPQGDGFRVIHFVLTSNGWECYARITGGSIPASYRSDDGSPLRD